jgi:kumamolisin
VAGDGSPETGYEIWVSGQKQVVGGTSAVAPLWAGLTALINQGAATPVGFFLTSLYANPTLLRQITTGNNIPSGSELGYQAGPGWNACTGLGVPNGLALFDALTSASGTDTGSTGGSGGAGGGSYNDGAGGGSGSAAARSNKR